MKIEEKLKNLKRAYSAIEPGREFKKTGFLKLKQRIENERIGVKRAVLLRYAMTAALAILLIAVSGTILLKATNKDTNAALFYKNQIENLPSRIGNSLFNAYQTQIKTENAPKLLKKEETQNTPQSSASAASTNSATPTPNRESEKTREKSNPQGISAKKEPKEIRKAATQEKTGEKSGNTRGNDHRNNDQSEMDTIKQTLKDAEKIIPINANRAD
ncbi:hypothetical protein M1615_01770 [Patescibacteria group bacterium]|nr:hypothetical protein [Patescibacteria group bacterium]MCL5010302.1 hypothetical protein [Patescibacteria group bacterium]